MKVAITGASGFIGSEVVSAFAAMPQVQLVPVSRQDTDYSVESLGEILSGVDAVIHLAAVRGTTGTKQDYSDNEIITENLLLACGQAGVKRFVFASTIAVYSDVKTIPWNEEMPLRPKTLYGITKASCEHMIMYYSQKLGFDYSIIRIAQVLGAGEKRRGMMNVFIDTAAAGGTIKVMGKSVAKRQYVYVKDLTELLRDEAVMLSGESVVLNAGMPAAYSNLEIAQIVNGVYENATPIDYDDSTPEVIEPSDMDINRLVSRWGRKPLDMAEALRDMKG